MRNFHISLLLPGLLGLVACEGTPFGRPAGSESDVKLVGVGVHPDEVGPSPEPKGGVVEYDHVEFAGAGLSLGLMGLGGTSPVGPGMMSFAPPYQAIFAFSYVFDQKLPAASTLAQIGQAPPEVPDSCYTAFSPSGPIGSFTTVDVGDFMMFSTDPAGLRAEGSSGLRMARTPADYPPDAQDTFIYYIGVEEYKPFNLTHKVPDPANPTDPAAMVDVPYRWQNYPFGQQVYFQFPGGFARQDQVVSSVPRPSASAGENSITLPDPLGPVALTWSGPRYNASGEPLAESGEQARCFEFYEGRADGGIDLEACRTPVALPDGESTFDSFEGQMYTGPWEAEPNAEGVKGVSFQWEPGLNGDQVVLSLRWMAPIDRDEAQYKYWGVQQPDGTYRVAQVCEEGHENSEPVYDAASYEDRNGNLLPSLRGDPQSQLATVTCLLADDGEFTLTEDHLKNALEHVRLDPNGAGGVVFYLSRGNQVDAENIPPAKDLYGQRHDISPIQVTARSVRIGRFWWNE